MRLDVETKRSLMVRLLEFGILPLSITTEFAGKQYRRFARRRYERRTLSYTPATAAWNRVLNVFLKIVDYTAKVAFLGTLLFLIWKAVSGLYAFNWGVIRDNIGTLLIWRFPHGDETELFWGLGGLSFSILMSVIAISVSFFIGLVVGLGRTSKNLVFRIPSLIYIEVIRGNPLIIVIFWVYFFIPVVTGAFFDVFWSATIALTVFTGAYLAEIVRAGVQNIPPGQVEAAYSTGLNYFQTMRRIILPQALKQMIPAIVGQFIAIFKDTSLAFVIGVLELTFVAQGLNNRLMVYPFEIYTTVAFLYFICCYAMSRYARRLEIRLSPEEIKLQM
jgi:polar amino acid transport system permease protein